MCATELIWLLQRREKYLSTSGAKTWFLDCSVCGLVTLLTELLCVPIKSKLWNISSSSLQCQDVDHMEFGCYVMWCMLPCFCFFPPLPVPPPALPQLTIQTSGGHSRVKCTPSSAYKALQPVKDSGLLNYILPTVSVLCYFLPIAYVHAIYIFQNVIRFRSSNWSFRYGFPSLDLLHIIILGHAFDMAKAV